MAEKKLTPMMRQYQEIKEKYSDCILFYRMGDFYELFNEDAKIASSLLGLTLTKRSSKAEDSAPLCGFPYHAAERYIPKMVQAGYKVAICEQVEDPKTAKGIVKRDVVEVVTAGTNLNESTLDSKSNNFLVGVYLDKKDKGLAYLSSLDISTGYFISAQGTLPEIEQEIYRLNPKEVLVSEENFEEIPFLEELRNAEKVLITLLSKDLFRHDTNLELLCKQFKIESLESFGLSHQSQQICSAGAVLGYALDQKKTALDHLNKLEVYNLKDFMVLDPSTLRNLEILKPLNSDDYNSTLISVLDYTITAMGGRKLKYWLSHPLVQLEKIQSRLSAVETISRDALLQDSLKNELQEINDIERLIGRIGSGRANGRDLLAMGKSLQKASRLSEILKEIDSPLFQKLSFEGLDLTEKSNLILDTISEEPPLTVREGKLIRRGASDRLDALNEGIREAREWLAGLEAREKKVLGIPTLKVGFNKVFGYYLETTKNHVDKIPDTYIRKQTLTNGERFITPEMKDYETKILNAESQINQLEYDLFSDLRNQINSWAVMLSEIAEKISVIDSLYSLAVAAKKNNFTRPEVHEESSLDIRGGWHPVIAAINPDIQFITNNSVMDARSNQIMLITGPNMAGKSTYLRQTGLITLMAQIGSFVPADSASIGLTDRIFTRVGASDRLAMGQSTFMVEMIETANILNNATSKSLILLDEIGRGTSTFDGLSLAWAIVENLHENPEIAGKTLFATHYHELTTLEDSLERVSNYHISVKENNGTLLFLRKIKQGACDSSYGIQVAQMAGLPKEVIARAKRILIRLEKNRTNPVDDNFVVEEKPQQDLFEPEPMTEDFQLALQELENADLNTMTPIQAMNLLVDIKEQFLKKGTVQS